jgi:CBS domain containing-hemolysin-like protein
LRVLIRQPLVFPETLPLLQALEQFRSARTHFAFVVDEFGSVEGMVTLSDVMETIAGNLPNEVERLMPATIFRKTVTVAGPRMAICRWKIWCNMCRCRWMKNGNITRLPGY